MGLRTTQQTKALFLEKFHDRPFITYACDAVDINRSTYYRWIEKDKAFGAKVKELSTMTRKVRLVESSLFTKALQGNVTAAIFILCNKLKSEYQSVNRHQVEGKVDHQHTITLTEEEEEKISEFLEGNGFLDRFGGRN